MFSNAKIHISVIKFENYLHSKIIIFAFENIVFGNQKHLFIWAAMLANVTLLHANNKGADRPAYPCRLISPFVQNSSWSLNLSRLV